MIKIKTLLISSLVAVSAVASAQQLTFGFNVPAPVYVEPSQPYYQQPRYYAPPPVYYVQPRQSWERHDWERRREWERNNWDRRNRRGYGDADRDGVPDRFDYAPYNPYRR